MNKAKRIKEIIGYICICVEVVAGWFIIYIAKEGFIPVYKDYGWNIPGPTKILLWFTSQPLFSTPFFSLSICILLIFEVLLQMLLHNIINVSMYSRCKPVLSLT